MADAGGVLSTLKGLFTTQAPDNFATAMERSGVTPAGLGTGYVVFFTYSGLFGVFAIVLSLVVLRRQREEQRSSV